MKYCAAKTRSGTPCKKPGMANGRCRLHGGLTPIKHGRYSKAPRLTIGEMLFRERLKEVFRIMQLLEPYLDPATKAGLERAMEAYAESKSSILKEAFSRR